MDQTTKENDNPAFGKPVNKGTGWKPDIPDFRDLKFGASMAVQPIADLPTKASIRPNCSPVRDQGDLGACTGFAITGAIEYLRRTDDDEFSTIYSPLFVYYEERGAEGTIDVDAGAFLRTGIKIVNKVGVPPESRWTYESEGNKFKRLPVAMAYKDARRWRLGSYHRCEGLQDVLNALAQGHPVVFGFACYTNMNTAEVWRTGKIPMPTFRDRLTGGHAVLATGYDLDAGLLEFKNSWGAAWGDEGYGYLPLEYVENRDLSDDYWCLTAEA